MGGIEVVPYFGKLNIFWKSSKENIKVADQLEGMTVHYSGK